MKHSLVDHLVCPVSKHPLRLEIFEADRVGEIKTGCLLSPTGSSYEIRNWIPRFVHDDSYSDTFTRQRKYVRKHFDQIRRDQAAQSELLLSSTGFSLSPIDGLTLDAGCGWGRFTRIVAASGSHVVGVDLSSTTVDLAFEYAGRDENVHIIQADLVSLPFRNDTFRRIFSIGVLHHTPNTEESFRMLLPYLCRGGEIAIWVYAPEKKRSANRWRRVTTKLPLPVVYGWCVLDSVLFAWLRGLPGGGKISAAIPGPSLGSGGLWERALGNFDSLTPRYAHTHAPEEIIRWFRTAGLVDIEELARRSSVRGRKPLSSS